MQMNIKNIVGIKVLVTVISALPRHFLYYSLCLKAFKITKKILVTIILAIIFFASLLYDLYKETLLDCYI